jgi:hypothetical protein
LPLQKAARTNKNSEFIDESFNPYRDQWAFLSSIQKISEARLEELISKLCPGHDLGTLKADPEEETEKPWERRITKPELHKNDFPERIDIIKANMLNCRTQLFTGRSIKAVTLTQSPSSSRKRLEPHDVINTFVCE